jgi:hypothetical protein
MTEKYSTDELGDAVPTLVEQLLDTKGAVRPQGHHLNCERKPRSEEENQTVANGQSTERAPSE